MILDPVDLLDGDGLRRNQRLEIAGDRIVSVGPGTGPGTGTDGPLFCPALVDLQVNGGGGVMVNDITDGAEFRRLRAAHAARGTGDILPTLISDTAEVTDRVIAAATQDGSGLGLHLEGPHLGVAGAHDPARLRDMTDGDVDRYRAAAAALPHLMITVDPDRVGPRQIAALTEAGVIVALGHSACDYATALAAFDAGARMVTHLFNAMSGLHHRAPGLVGAALDRAPAFGLIADGHHVHDAALRLALSAGGDRAIPVSDAMALTGHSGASFSFQGRTIRRQGTKLTLSDGTLAGAQASLAQGLQHLARVTGRPLADLLPLGFDRPWRFLGRGPRRIRAGDAAKLIEIDADGSVRLVLGNTGPSAAKL